MRYTDWNDVPATTESKIRKVWNGYGTITSETVAKDGENLTVYKLASHKVRENLEYLTTEQKLKIFEIANDKELILSSLLERLSFDTECVRVHNEVYHLPGIVVGTWPHCNLFGGMDETGYIHT